MVLIGEVELIVSDPGDESVDADIISSGEDFGAFRISRWPFVARIIRSRRARIVAVPVLAAMLATAAATATDSHQATEPAQPSQQVTITNTAVGGAGMVGYEGWIGAAGCRRGRACPRG